MVGAGSHTGVGVGAGVSVGVGVGAGVSVGVGVGAGVEVGIGFGSQEGGVLCIGSKKRSGMGMSVLQPDSTSTKSKMRTATKTFFIKHTILLLGA